MQKTERIYGMKRIRIGVDNGNYNTKSSERMLYASGFATSDKDFITSDMQLFYENTYYAVGGRRMSFQQGHPSPRYCLVWDFPSTFTGHKRNRSVNTSCGRKSASALRIRISIAGLWTARYIRSRPLRAL